MLKMNFSPKSIGTVLLFLGIFSISCTSDNLLTEIISKNQTPDPAEGGAEPTTSNGVLTINKTPCTYTLANLTAGETLAIDCQLDLGGATIELPENVTLKYNKGEIINGILKFKGGTIDGELLNNKLSIEGTVTLSNPDFFFYPERWGQIQGKTSTANAQKNKDFLQQAIDVSKTLGAVSFSIDEYDSYFAVGSWQHTAVAVEDAIHLPSHFHLKMTANTFLRLQPSNWAKSLLLGVNLKSNVKITGGNLIGDRYTHDYSPVNDEFGIARNSHEWPTLIGVFGCEDVVVDGVYMTDATGDAVVLGGGILRTRPDAQWNKNITVKNCTMNASRRNNITFGDGEYLTLENCVISNAGGGEHQRNSDGSIIYGDAGVAPQFGLDLEAYRERDANNQLVEYERVEHVTIRGNTFKGNYAGDIVVYTANDVLIENNQLDNTIGGTGFFNCIIKNNTLVANSKGLKTSTAIGFQERIVNGENLVYNNEISGNTISGFDTAISVGGENITVENNIATDFLQAIFFRNLRNSTISANNFKSDRSICYGYMTIGSEFKNVIINNDVVEVTHKPINFMGINKSIAIDTKFTFDNVDFSSRGNRSLYLEDAHNVTIKNSKWNSDVQQVRTSGIVLQNNN